MNRITQQTWDQLTTEGLAVVGLAITAGNQLGWWSIGSDAQQTILEGGTLTLAFIATLIYGVNSTPNRVADKMVAMAYDHGYTKAMAREDKGGI